MIVSPDQTEATGSRILRSRAGFMDFEAKYLVLFDTLASHAPEGGLPLLNC